MNILTVQTLHRHGLPAGTRLVAGADGLGRAVSWPVTLRTRVPGFPSLKGGELLLIATESLRVLDPSLNLTRLLERVEHVGVGGAAILGRVDEGSIAYADAHALPLFALPPGTYLAEVEAALARVVAEARSELHRRGHEVYRQLTQMGIEGRGLPAIAQELDRATGKPALVLDAALAPVARSRNGSEDPIVAALAPLASTVRAWTEEVPIAAAKAPVEFFGLVDRLGLLVAPVMAGAAVSAFVAVSTTADHVDELDRSAVAGAAAAAAIELARQLAVLDAEQNAQAEIVEELLTRPAPVSDGLRRRAARLGLDLNRAHVVVATTALPRPPSPSFMDVAKRLVESILPEGHVSGVDGRVVLISPIDDARLRSAAEALRRELAQRLVERELSCGVGRLLPGVDGLRQSFREAVGAVEQGQQLCGPGRTVFFADLGLDRLLLGIWDHPEVGQFYEDTLGKLIARDARNAAELLRTLEVYFACHGSPTQAAAQLHVHRNTLLYRLKRIRGVAGIDLDDPDVRLALQVALRIHRVRGATRKGASPSGIR